VEKIREVDAQIEHKEFIDPETLNQYKIIIGTAEKEKIQAADVILCTCTTSARGRIRKNTNIMQVGNCSLLQVI